MGKQVMDLKVPNDKVEYDNDGKIIKYKTYTDWNGQLAESSYSRDENNNIYIEGDEPEHGYHPKRKVSENEIPLEVRAAFNAGNKEALESLTQSLNRLKL